MNISIYNQDKLIPIGTKVFIPHGATGEIREDEIIGYQARVMKKDEDLLVVASDYLLNMVNFRNPGIDNLWKAQEFCLTKEEAEPLAKTYLITVSSDEWVDAIGVDRNGDRSILDKDECELQICCGMVSNIRDVLIEAMDSNSIDGIDRRILISLLRLHEEPTPAPILTKILSQIGITNWKEGIVTVDGVRQEQD